MTQEIEKQNRSHVVKGKLGVKPGRNLVPVLLLKRCTYCESRFFAAEAETRICPDCEEPNLLPKFLSSGLKKQTPAA